MKILVVGSDKIFAIENFYVKYMREFGLTVDLFSSQSLFFNYYNRSLINKGLFKLGVARIYYQINQELRHKIEADQPRLVWIFKGMEIFPSTLQWIKSRGIKIVNYNPDNPFLFSGKGSGNRNITDSLGLYDFHFTYNLEIQKKLISKFNAKTAWLPFGFDISEELLLACEQQQEVKGVCFLGNPDKDRSNFIRSLADMQIPITVYGLHWDSFINHPLVENAGPVYGDDLWKVLRRYRVQLNFMRPHNLNSHNMRTFEVPGVGGIMVAPDTEEHRLFFEHGKEVFLFNDIPDCSRHIRTALGLDTEKANQIRVAARDRSLKSGYRYEDRARAVIKVIEPWL